MKLTAYNPSLENLEKTYFSKAYSAGSTSLLVKNNNSVSVNDRILLGEMGRETSEIVTVSAVNSDGVTLTVGATKFPHSVDDPIYALRYDQIRFYRSTDGTSYSVLTTIPMDVDNQELKTYYNDTTGLSTYLYKISFYNSVALSESSLSDPMPGQGYSRNQVGTIVREVLEEVGDLQQQYVQVTQLLSWFNDCNDNLSTQTRKPWRWLRSSWALNTQAGNPRIAIPTTVKALDYTYYDFTTNSLLADRTMEIIPIQEMQNIDRNFLDTGDDLIYLAIDETTNELVLFPTPLTSRTAALTIYGWKNFTEITSLSNTIEMPNPLIYKLYLKSQFYRLRSASDATYAQLAGQYWQDFTTEIVKLGRMSRIDVGTPQGITPDRRSSYSRFGYRHR